MSFKIIGARDGWLIITDKKREICFFAEESGTHNGLRKALHYINYRINNSIQQFDRLQSLYLQ